MNISGSKSQITDKSLSMDAEKKVQNQYDVEGEGIR